MRFSIEKADFALRLLTFFTILAGGGWAIYQYQIAGATDWADNITIETKVLPYHDNLRLLVIHVKSKNPRNYEFDLDANDGDSYELRIRKVAMDAKAETIIGEDQGELIQKVDILKESGGAYEFLSDLEMDDMRSIVLPVNSIVQLTAEMHIHTGETGDDGKPDTDFVSASTVVRVE